MKRHGNVKYKNLDDNLMEVINSEAKAYFLGWIASDGHVGKKNFTSIVIKKKDSTVLELIVDALNIDTEIKHSFIRQTSKLYISSKKIRDDVARHLNIESGKKDKVVDFPHHLATDELKWAFIRGFFDGDGSVYFKSKDRKTPYCSITTNSEKMRKAIKEFSNIPCNETVTDHSKSVRWSGNNALDFLGKIYDESNIHLSRKRDLYLDMCYWVPGLSGVGTSGNEPLFKWNKSDKRAVKPFKERVSDSGWDLTLIDIWKKVGEVTYYETGIKVQPEYGWYFDLVPRSSLTKTGYILANSVGIIDRTYVGTIKVPLIKIDKNAPDLEVPGRHVQIIPRPIIHARMVEGKVDQSHRSEGGFGSTSVGANITR